MKKISIENNLSETAFFIKSKTPDEYNFDIKWFTNVGAEISLCGFFK